MSVGFRTEERAFAVAQKCAAQLWLSCSPCAIDDDTYQAIHAVRDELLRAAGDERVTREELLTRHGLNAPEELLEQLAEYERVWKEAAYLYGLALAFTFARGGAR
jgi:hypothetical protein